MIAVFVTALAVTACGMLFVLPLLKRAQVLDVPNVRSSHVSPIPRGGGVAVILGILFGCLLAFSSSYPVPGLVLTAVVAFAGLGLIDDLRGLDVKFRLVVQLSVAALVAFVVIGPSTVATGALAVVAAVWLVGYTNAFNFMDGVNGISALNAALAGGWFAYLGVTRELDAVAVLGLAVAGAALGFLPWNAPQAKVFLGDVGSYGLGFILAALALLAWNGGVNLLLALAPLTVYLADTGWALARRIWGRRPWHEAHREHVYQQLTDGGWSHLASGALAALFAAVVCGLAALMNPGPVVVALAAAALMAYLTTPIVVRERERTGAGSL